MFSFLKYDDKAKPGKKRPKSPETKAVDGKKWKQYENKRPERKFNHEWTTGREWLVYEEGVMKCSMCIEHYKTTKKEESLGLRGQNTFILGSSNLKKSAVTDHEASKSHQAATTKKVMLLSKLKATKGSVSVMGYFLSLIVEYVVYMKNIRSESAFEITFFIVKITCSVQRLSTGHNSSIIY